MTETQFRLAPCFTKGEAKVRKEVSYTMRNYEAMYVLRPDLDEEQVNAAIEKFSEIITKNGGEVTKVEQWGKRRLAYEVQKLREGFYVLCNFAADTELPKELERNFKISDQVIRYLVIREGE